MGCLGSKDKLTKEDMEFLKSHTRYDEATIKEWYKGFKVKFSVLLLHTSQVCMQFTLAKAEYPLLCANV